MEIERLSPDGEPFATIDLRIHFQIVRDHGAEFIEGVMVSFTDGQLPGMSSPVIVREDAPDPIHVNRTLLTSRGYAVRMPRPTLDDREQQGGDLGTMQAMLAALTKAFDQGRR